MKWLRVPVLIVLLMPSCSLMVEDASYFDGEWQSPGAAGKRSDSAAGDGSVAVDGGAAGASTTNPAGTAGGVGDEGAVGGAGGAAGDPGSGGTTSTAGGAAPANPCGKPQCSPNEVETAKQSCGACGTGQQARTRKCSADTCSWGAWGAWSMQRGDGHLHAGTNQRLHQRR